MKYTPHNLALGIKNSQVALGWLARQEIDERMEMHIDYHLKKIMKLTNIKEGIGFRYKYF